MQAVPCCARFRACQQRLGVPWRHRPRHACWLSWTRHARRCANRAVARPSKARSPRAGQGLPKQPAHAKHVSVGVLAAHGRQSAGSVSSCSFPEGFNCSRGPRAACCGAGRRSKRLLAVDDPACPIQRVAFIGHSGQRSGNPPPRLARQAPNASSSPPAERAGVGRLVLARKGKGHRHRLFAARTSGSQALHAGKRLVRVAGRNRPASWMAWSRFSPAPASAGPCARVGAVSFFSAGLCNA